MTVASFNVLTEPWIPVVRPNGSSDEMGIVECLERAHELREIRDPAPTVEFGIYRLLVAFVLDMLILADQRPEDPLDLRVLLQAGRFDSAAIADYVNRCGDVFDLFSPQRPFLQNPNAGGEEKSVFDFFPVFPSGANVVHFAHQRSSDQIATPAEMVRLLTTVSPFNVKVKTGQPRTIVGDPPVYALPVGDSVFSTLVLNLPLPDPRFTLADELKTGPVWRSIPTEGQSGTAPAQSLTWPCRRVKLSLPDATGHVKSITNETGLKALAFWKDPSCAIFEGDGKTRHLRLQTSRPLWLDAGPLSLLAEGSVKRGKNDWVFVRPEVVSTALSAEQGGNLRVRFYGWRTDQAKVYEWIVCQWAVPSKLALSLRLGSLVHLELQRAESAARALHTGVLGLAPEFEREEKKVRNRKAWDKREMRGLADRCERAYWQRLEPEFRPLMAAFAALEPDAPDDLELVQATAAGWRKAIRSNALEQFESAARDMDADGDALERQVKARNRLTFRLKEVLS
jgi:CRISPR type I-E-associated protein CasA/Cse1